MRLGRMVLVVSIGLVTLASATVASPAPDRVVERMSLREKVGQLVMFSVEGTRLTSTERSLMRRHDLGGVILFAQNYDDRSQLQTLTNQIQRETRGSTPHSIGALISVDQEGGPVKRFPDMPPRYSAPEIGESGDESLAFGQGRATGRALASVGVNVDLAPVADLDLPPNHIMRSRSFGTKPHRVGRLVSAFSRGLQARRTVATLKHFPGLGGATINSDDGRAYVRRSKRKLHNIDAIPFHKAIGDGARMVMLSHGVYLKDGGQKPASVNRYIATKRLRDEFGFEGVAISDALEPVSWKFDGSTPRACRATIRAGVDIALITGDARMAGRCAAEIRQAVRAGAITQRRIDQAVGRVLDLKRWLGLL